MLKGLHQAIEGAEVYIPNSKTLPPDCRGRVSLVIIDGRNLFVYSGNNEVKLTGYALKSVRKQLEKISL
jgi:hypothetical protein